MPGVRPRTWPFGPQTSVDEAHRPDDARVVDEAPAEERDPIVGEHGREAAGATRARRRRNVLQRADDLELLVPATWPWRRKRRDRSAVVHERTGDAVGMTARAPGGHLERAAGDVGRHRSERVVLDGRIPESTVTCVARSGARERADGRGERVLVTGDREHRRRGSSGRACRQRQRRDREEEGYRGANERLHEGGSFRLLDCADPTLWLKEGLAPSGCLSQQRFWDSPHSGTVPVARTATALAARQLEHERRPVRELGVDEDLAVHPPRELAADVEAEARAAAALRLLRVDTVELFEDRFLLGRRNADSLVRDRQPHVSVVLLD